MVRQNDGFDDIAFLDRRISFVWRSDPQKCGALIAPLDLHAFILKSARLAIVETAPRQSCEHCNAEAAEIPFDNVLDRVTGSDPSVTNYVLEQPPTLDACLRRFRGLQRLQRLRPPFGDYCERTARLLHAGKRGFQTKAATS